MCAHGATLPRAGSDIHQIGLVSRVLFHAMRQARDKVSQMRRGLSSGRVVRDLRIVLALAAVVLCLLAVLGNWRHFSADLSKVGLLRTVLSVPLLVGGLSAGMLAWRQILAGLGSPLTLQTASKIYFIGQLGKYVPGSVWPVLAQMELGRDHGVPRRRSIVAMVTAIVLSLTTALTLAGLTVPLLPADYRARLWWLMIPVPFLVAMLHPRVLWALLRRIPRLRLLEGQPEPPALATMFRATCWCLAGWLCYGLHIAVLALAFHPHDLGVLFVVCLGGYALAWCAGLVVFLLPAGAGARDLALVGALATVLPTGPALAVAVISRMVTTACDLGCAGLAFATSHQALGRIGGPGQSARKNEQILGATPDLAQTPR